MLQFENETANRTTITLTANLEFLNILINYFGLYLLRKCASQIKTRELNLASRNNPIVYRLQKHL